MQPRTAVPGTPRPPRPWRPGEARRGGGVLKVLLGGDIMGGRGVDQILSGSAAQDLSDEDRRETRRGLRLARRLHGAIPRRVGAAYPWGEALEAIELQAADLRIVNLESPLTTAVTAWTGKEEHQRASPTLAHTLRMGRIDACALANDHILDWDHPGLRDTLSALAGAGIAGAGAGADALAAAAPAILQPRGQPRVLVFAWATPGCGVPAGWAASAQRPGIALLPALGEADARAVQQQVAACRRGGDRVVVSLHWGGPWVRRPPDEQREFARRLIDLGAADIVHGHGAQHPLPVEVHAGRLIVHGCGALISDTEGLPAPLGFRPDLACFYAATLGAEDGRLCALEVIGFQRRRFQLARPEPLAAAWLEEALVDGAPGPRLAFEGAGPARWRLQGLG